MSNREEYSRSSALRKRSPNTTITRCRIQDSEKKKFDSLSKLINTIYSKDDKYWKQNRNKEEINLAITAELVELYDRLPWRWTSDDETERINTSNIKLIYIEIIRYLVAGSILTDQHLNSIPVEIGNYNDINIYLELLQYTLKSDYNTLFNCIIKLGFDLDVNIVHLVLCDGYLNLYDDKIDTDPRSDVEVMNKLIDNCQTHKDILKNIKEAFNIEND